MSTDAVAQDQIKAYVDRILRMKEEAKAINSDIREIYAEAKGNGFDKTVLGKLVNYVEKRNSDASAVAEGEALFDLYLTAYYGVGTVVATHTHEAIFNPQSAPRSERDLTAPQPLGQVADIQPETASGSDHTSKSTAVHTDAGNTGVTGGESAATNRVISMTGLEPRQAGGLKGFGFTVKIEDRPAKLYRPLCLNRERCGASGPKECWKCLKAAEQGSAA